MAAVAIRRTQNSNKQLTPEQQQQKLQEEEAYQVYKQKNNLERLLNVIDEDIKQSLHNDTNYNALGNDYIAKYNYVNNLKIQKIAEREIQQKQEQLDKLITNLRKINETKLSEILNNEEYMNASLENKINMIKVNIPSIGERVSTFFRKKTNGGKYITKRKKSKSKSKNKKRKTKRRIRKL
jgi:hypothetical protein